MTLWQKILKVVLIGAGILGCLGTMFSVVISPYLIFLPLPSVICFVGGTMIGSEFPE
jgi:hypothetical protein